MLVLVTGLGGIARAERVALGVPLTQRGFEKIAHRKGVAVYKHETSSIIRLGAEGRFNATPREVLHAVLDYDNQVGVVDRLSEVKVLSRSGHSLRVYQRLNLPVISDRDFNLKVTWWKKGETYIVAYRALRGVSPPRDGVVRVTHHYGSWQLKPVNNGRQTLARFQVEIDLAGWLPRWMAKSGSGKEVPELYGSIDRLIKRTRLRSASCTSNCL
jgi:hypothetical protein